MIESNVITKCSNFISPRARRTAVASLAAAGMLSALALGSLATLTGCATDEVGRSKTTTKQTIDSPTQKSTVTETKTKETTFTPR